MNHPWMKLWYRGKEILIKKVFHLTHKENIEKAKEALKKQGEGLILSLWILWNYVLSGHNDSAKNDAEFAENDVTNFGNLVELLWHRVKRGNRNLEKGGNIKLENNIQNGPWMPHVLLLQFRFILFVFVVFQGKLQY